jgi:hypothetical protein
VSLPELDVSFHLVRIEDLVESHQAMNGLSNRRSLWGIHNATMRIPSSMETEEIAILCKDGYVHRGRDSLLDRPEENEEVIGTLFSSGEIRGQDE